MSLNQKFTWKDFLKENPQVKGKELKRTSPEGKKAFDAAYKAKIKDVLKDRLAWIEKEVVRVIEKKKSSITAIKALKTPVARRHVEEKIARNDKYIHKLKRTTDKTKQIQKSF